jgi:hypothetical protein
MTKHPILDRTEKLRAAITRLQLDCLDNVWQGWRARYRFVCPKGHIALRSPSAIVKTAGSCYECRMEQRTERFRAAVQVAGTTWLNERWLGRNVDYHFRCKQGHEWQRTNVNAASRFACPICPPVVVPNPLWRGGLERLQQAAARRGGECLAETFAGMSQKYRFRCAAGHVFQANGRAILWEGWCIRCSSFSRGKATLLKDGLQRLNECAERQGGVCLDTVYRGMTRRYRFRCRFLHEWEATGKAVTEGSWCVKCKNAGKGLTIEEAQRLAQIKGGQCLSTEYSGAGIKLHWQCACGHRWYTLLATIRAGSWCLKCSHIKRMVRSCLDVRTFEKR